MREREIRYMVDGFEHTVALPGRLTDEQALSIQLTLTGQLYERTITPWFPVHFRLPETTREGES